MKLFFETSHQAMCFLLMAPAGFLAALLLDADALAGVLRPLADVAVLLLAGAAVLVLTSAAGESGVRLYHLLGALTGAVVYLCGAGRIVRMLKRKKAAVRQEKRTRMQKDIHSEKG